MLSVIQNRSVTFLEGLVQTMEQYSQLEAEEKRLRIFTSDKKDEQQTTEEPAAKLTDLSLELLDLTVFQGVKGFNYFKTTQAYQLTNPYLQYQERAVLVKDSSLQAINYFNDKIYFPLKENLFVIYDKTTNVISFMFKVFAEHQSKVLDYVTKNYKNVTIKIKDQWMRLDFNNDGEVSFEDLRQGVFELYDFMKSYQYLEKVQEIRSTLYHQAIKHMRRTMSDDSKMTGQENSHPDTFFVEDE